MAAPKFGNWFQVKDGQAIPSQHLPASHWQYRWRIDTDFDIPYSWWGTSGGTTKMKFALKIGDGFQSEDEISFVCVVQEDLFTVGLLAFWTYYPGVIRMSGGQAYPTFAGDEGWWEYWGPTSDYGLTAGDIDGALYSPIYELDLPVGAVVDVTKYHYCTNLPGGYRLEMRTARGGANTRTRMLIDPVAADRHTFRVVNKALLRRTRLSAEGVLDGAQSGLGVSIAGGVVTVAAGTAIVDYQSWELMAAAQVSAGSGTVYIFFEPLAGGLGQIVTSPGPLGTPACCLGMVEGGKTLTALNGTLVATGVEDYSVGRHEDGAMVVCYDTAGAQGTMVVSRDRGVTWG